MELDHKAFAKAWQQAGDKASASRLIRCLPLDDRMDIAMALSKGKGKVKTKAALEVAHVMATGEARYLDFDLAEVCRQHPIVLARLLKLADPRNTARKGNDCYRAMDRLGGIPSPLATEKLLEIALLRYGKWDGEYEPLHAIKVLTEHKGGETRVYDACLEIYEKEKEFCRMCKLGGKYYDGRLGELTGYIMPVITKIRSERSDSIVKEIVERGVIKCKHGGWPTDAFLEYATGHTIYSLSEAFVRALRYVLESDDPKWVNVISPLEHDDSYYAGSAINTYGGLSKWVRGYLKKMKRKEGQGAMET